ncbi:tetratricopeptide repeat protein, partial [Siccirubricoccus sp. KC 17139]
RPAPPPIAAAAPRPPERALAEGQAALSRRDYATAEAAAREVLANRSSPRATDAQLLLGDALAGKRDFGNAALAYNDAYTRARTGPRAPDALIGLANSLQGLGNRREACDTLDELRSNFPNLTGARAERVAEARRRAGCRG